LQGEAASSLSPVAVRPPGAQYDWRELQRWHISNEHLPRGSIVKFRAPSFWERYRAWILTGLSALVVQTALIAGLLLNLRKRRKAERSLRESEERMQLAASAAELGMWEWDFRSRKLWVDGKGIDRNGVDDGADSD